MVEILSKQNRKHKFGFVLFFRNQEDKSKSLIKSESHRKKDRQRNLLPAKTGILLLVLVLLVTLAYSASYGLDLDVYTRSFYLAFVNSLFHPIISPMIVVFEAPVIRRKINKTFLMYKSQFYEKVLKKDLVKLKSHGPTTPTHPGRSVVQHELPFRKRTSQVL